MKRTCLKWCHLTLPEPTPQSLPQCARCKTRYVEEDNDDTACSYHATQAGKLWCKKCMQACAFH